MELEIKIKIGEIEFYAKGEPDDVEIQRQFFINSVLPAAIEVAKTNYAQITDDYRQNVNSTPVSNGFIFEPSESNRNLSVNEFISKKGFATNIDIAIGLIYYNASCREQGLLYSRDFLIQ